MILKKFLLLTLVVASAVVANGRASAGTISYSADVAAQPTSFSETVALPKFDTSLGTLTGVTISFTTNVNSIVKVANFTGVTQPFTNAQASIPFSVIGPDASSASGTAVTTVGSGNIASGIGPYDFPGLPTTASGQVAVPSSNWSSYQGVGVTFANFDFIGANGTFTGTAANLVFFGGSAVADGHIVITYEYETAAVPEPSTFVLGACGLVAAGLGCVRRKRQQQA